MKTTYTPSRAVQMLIDYAVGVNGFGGPEGRAVALGALRRVVLDEMLQIGNYSSVAELTEMASAWCDAAIASANA